MPVDFYLPKRVPSPKPNPKVDFRLYMAAILNKMLSYRRETALHGAL